MNQKDWFSWKSASISVARNSSTSLLVAATRSLQPVCGSPGAMVRPRQGVSNRLKFRSDMFATKSWGDFSWFYKYYLIEQFASCHGSSQMPSPCCQLLSERWLYSACPMMLVQLFEQLPITIQPLRLAPQNLLWNPEDDGFVVAPCWVKIVTLWHRLLLPVFSLATFGESYFQVLGPKRSTDSSFIKSMGYIRSCMTFITLPFLLQDCGK